jgi:hypothetical protein
VDRRFELHYTELDTAVKGIKLAEIQQAQKEDPSIGPLVEAVRTR